jgi:phosphocarrier protein
MAETPVIRHVAVVNEYGIHARSAVLIAGLARRLKAKIVLLAQDERAECTSVLQVLTLAMRRGTQVRIEATGAEAETSAEVMAWLIGEGLKGIEDGELVEKPA